MIPEVDFNQFAIDQIPPIKRYPRFIASNQGWLSQMVRLNSIFVQYMNGTTANNYDPSIIYVKGETVIFNYAAYESISNSNTGNIPNVLNSIYWIKILDSFIGMRERSQYCASHLIFEYALNRYFQTTFRQPDDPINPSNSDIFTHNSTDTYLSFLVGTSETGTDQIATTYSSGYITQDEDFGNESTFFFHIHIPVDVYKAINIDPLIANSIVRQFADKYVASGIQYLVHTYVLGLFNKYAGASVGFSFRQLEKNQTYCMRVRRASDNTTSDIGFNSNGDFNVTAFNAFVGVSNGYCKIFYDQSGNGNDATQLTNSKQPQIILNAGGTGFPALFFDNANSQELDLTSTITLLNGLVNISIIKKISTGDSINILSLASFPAFKECDSVYDSSGNTYVTIQSPVGTGYNLNPTSIVNDTNFKLIGASGDTSSGTLLNEQSYINGDVATTTSSSTQPISKYDNIGNRNGGFCKGYIFEVILYPYNTNAENIMLNCKTYYNL